MLSLFSLFWSPIAASFLMSDYQSLPFYFLNKLNGILEDEYLLSKSELNVYQLNFLSSLYFMLSIPANMGAITIMNINVYITSSKEIGQMTFYVHFLNTWRHNIHLLYSINNNRKIKIQYSFWLGLVFEPFSVVYSHLINPFEELTPNQYIIKGKQTYSTLKIYVHY